MTCLLFLAGHAQVAAQPPKRQDTPRAAQAQQKAPPAERSVQLDFDDVDFRDVIRFMGEITGKHFVVHPTVQGKVTVVSPKAVTAKEAYRIFQAVLEVHGFTTVPAGPFVKIVPSTEARAKAVDTTNGGSGTPAH
jgi:general secretion pathway protein D